MDKHNRSAYGKNKFTSKASDWIVYYTIRCSSYGQAVRIEKHIKRMKSRRYLQNLSRYPEMVLKLLDKYDHRI
jgi:putative endonuclease